jgi:hypothetical protein
MPNDEQESRTSPSTLGFVVGNASIFGGVTAAFGLSALALTSRITLSSCYDVAIGTLVMGSVGAAVGVAGVFGLRAAEFAGRAFDRLRNRRQHPKSEP